jgi:hypothetical protein
MATPPTSPNQNAIRGEALQIITLLGPDGGDWPTRQEEVDFLLPTRISRGTGGSRLNSISLNWALERSGDRLVDAVTPTGYNRLIDVLAYNPDDGSTRRLCWGKMADQSHYLSGRSETVQPTARIDPWLIAPLKTTGFYHHHDTFTKFMNDGQIVFNPEIDDRIIGNRASGMLPASLFNDVYWWLNPETVRSPGALAVQTITAEKWTLPQVVHSLCWLLNPDETYVTNPDLTDLEAVLTVAEVAAEDLVRNLEIDPDRWLTECLDQVLTPFGFGWYLEFDDNIATSGSAKQHTKIKVFKLNDGVNQLLYLQRPGTTAITRDKTNVADYHANISLTELANQIEGFTSPIVVESTFNLWPVWPVAADASTYDDLNTKEERENGTVHRQYVLNEDGSINNVRNVPTATTDLNALLTEEHPVDGARILSKRRRKFLPALSYGLDEGSAVANAQTDRELIGENGYLVEYQRRYTATGPTETTEDWTPIDWPFAVLKDQCGIRLTGTVPPELWTQLQEYPDDPPLRITCSIESDFARHLIADKREDSPQGDTVRAVLDLSRRFHVRRVDSTSSVYADRHPAIVSVATGSGGSFSISTAPAVPLRAGDRIAVIGSTGNDGAYTVSFLSGSAVNVVETIPDSTADGNLCLFTNESDDTLEMEDYLEHVRNWDDAADMSCSVTLDGIDHTEYRLSSLITDIDGRNLSLNASSAAGAARYLQVVGFNLELEGQQRMELLLDSFRVERFDFARNA